MKLIPKVFGLLLVCGSVLVLDACSTAGMRVADQSKPGFSNITDVPLPQSANLDMNRSMVMGGGDSWTGHLVYDTNRSQVEVVDFINSQMQGADWTKISELRGKETVITFMKAKRVATINIFADNGYFGKKTIVAMDMANSKLEAVKTNVVTETTGVSAS